MKTKKTLFVLSFVLLLLFAFAGLMITAGCGGNDDDEPKVETYVVTFDSDGGSEVASQNVTKNGKVTEPDDPSKINHTFDGWYNGSDLYDFDTPVTGTLTLTAHWSPVSVGEGFTATLKYENGKTDGSLIATKTGDDWFFTKPTDPQKDNNTFDGWFTEGGDLFDFTKPVTANTVLVAHWTPISIGEGFTATLKYENGKTDGSLTATKTGDDWFFTKPTDPQKDNNTFDGWFTEGGDLFDFTKPVTANTVLVAHWTPDGPKAEYTATLKYDNGDPDGALDAVQENDKWYYVKPTDPQKDYNVFEGWYTDVEKTHPYDFDSEVTASIPLYAKWSPAYDTVTTEWNFAESAAEISTATSGNVTLTANMTFNGKFLLGSGARFELGSKSCINSQKKTMEITLSGDGTNNAITFTAKWGSSSAGYFKFVNKKTEAVVYDSGMLANGSAEFTVSITDLPAGTYSLDSDGSVRFYAISVTEKLPQGPVSGLELDTSALETYALLGRPFDASGLTVKLAYENGRKDTLTLSQVTVTPPEDFATVAGARTITVEYQKDETHKYTETFTVYVLEPEEIVLYDYTMDSNRYANPLQVVYLRNAEKLDTDNLVVKARCLLPESNTEYYEFILSSDEYVISDVDMYTLGSKTVTVTYKEEFTKSYDIVVVSSSTLQDAPVTITVDPTAEIVSFSFAHEYTFHTINQALQFLKANEPYDTAVKTIILKEGVTYNEKVVFDMPNIVLKTDTDASFEGDWSYDNTEVHAAWAKYATIEYDSLNGLLDPSETITHSTNGSATVTITPAATNFKAVNVNFKNTYNTYEKYQQSLKLTNDTQAVAVLVQGDRASFENCIFSSYHDTLYAQVGRQYYKGCLIEGHTDYIFGYNATAVFDDCIIRSLGAGKTAAENSNYNNGGYIVSTKGFAKNVETDGIDYGYVFMNSQFIADDKTADGSVSIARSWDDNMHVMIMNSYIDKHISKEAFGEVTAGDSKNMNDRYGEMNANTLRPAYLLEYNNTGAGAIYKNLTDTCTYASEEVAAKFADINTVFTPFNGKVEYDCSWNPTKACDAVIAFKDDAGYWLPRYFNGNEGPWASFCWVGGVLTEKMLKDKAPIILASLVNSDEKKIEGFYQDQACTIPFDYKNTVMKDSPDVATQGVEGCQNIIYVKIVEGSSKETETFTANSTGYTPSVSSTGTPGGTSLRDNAYDGTAFSVVAGGSGDTKASTVGMTATANDDSGLTFNSAFVPGGSGRTYTITANQKIMIRVYYTVYNGDICTATTASTKEGELTIGGITVTSAGYKYNNVAYCFEMELNAGQSIAIGTNSSSNRLVLFGIVAEY